MSEPVCGRPVGFPPIACPCVLPSGHSSVIHLCDHVLDALSVNNVTR